MNPFLSPLIAIILVATLLGVIMKRLGQPLLIGYVLTGIIISSFGFSLLQHSDTLELFSTLGISLLLFLVGLGIKPEYIRDVGGVAIITGLAQIVFTTVIGVGLALALGFSLIPALYMATAFTFSSTIIVLRLLQDKGDEDTLYGRIAIGFLLVQDLAAMAVFLVLTAHTRTANIVEFGGLLALKMVALVLIAVLFVRVFLPKVDTFLADDRELLLLSSLAWCLLCSWGFFIVGFSYELGALFAGVTLSFSRDFREISSRVAPLRDFFLIMFFVVIGTNVSFADLPRLWIPISAFSAFILIGNPLILYIIMVWMRYTRKTAFFVGLTVAQISEFSLILIGLGVTLGQLDRDILIITTTVGLLTMALSSLMMAYNQSLFTFFEPVLKILSPRARRIDASQAPHETPMDLLLFGAHRLGGGILQQAQTLGKPYLVVDFDPHLVKQLEQQQVPVRWGSADDPVFLDGLDFSRLKLVISTIPDLDANLFLLSYMKKRRPAASVLCVAGHQTQAKQLYEAGADYVVMPPYLGRRFMVDLFKKNLFEHNKYKAEARRHQRDLRYLLPL